MEALIEPYDLSNPISSFYLNKTCFVTYGQFKSLIIGDRFAVQEFSSRNGQLKQQYDWMTEA